MAKLSVQILARINGFRPIFDGDFPNRSKNSWVQCGMPLARHATETAMKPRDANSYDGQNWAWPEKTWFRERLNAIKAREQESRRKGATSSEKSTQVKIKSSDAQGTEER